MVWSVGALVSHGTCPSATVSAYDRNTQLLHVIPKWNRKESGYTVCFGPQPSDGLANPSSDSYTASGPYVWNYGKFCLGEPTCPSVLNQGGPKRLGLHMVAH
eukprot:203479-Karenia_brevis.AAC.1